MKHDTEECDDKVVTHWHHIAASGVQIFNLYRTGSVTQFPDGLNCKIVTNKYVLLSSVLETITPVLNNTLKLSLMT